MEERIRRFFIHHTYRKKSNRSMRILVLFFAAVILVGALLLALPVSSRNGEGCGGVQALFTSTSAVCVVGLSLGDSYSLWSGFGQAVLLLLIQTGGLGYMTMVSMLYFLFRRRIGLQDRLVLQQALAVNELDGILKLLQLVVLGTFLIEAIGALILTARFSLEMPLSQAVWFGVFHSISAFCNAGFDLMGSVSPGGSMTGFASDPVVTLTVCALIILGGLGFFVWNDVLINRFHWRRMSVHTKLVLLTTGVLVFGGALVIFLIEQSNPGTLGALSPGGKLLAALFQSVTTRTAGFFSVNQADLTDSGKLISIILMFVGGSSGSTAGGMKTVTMALLVLSAVRVLRNRSELTVFGRKIADDQVHNAEAVCLLVVSVGIIGGLILAAANSLPLLDCLYETVSAICTVGLSAGITSTLGIGSKFLLIIYMFFGRVGVMTISFAFMTKTPTANAITHPEARVLVG